MKRTNASTDPLQRFWFVVETGLGYGVTAYSIEDAKQLLAQATQHLGENPQVVNLIESVNIRDLAQHHVVPNMGPPNVRGVWYPLLNL